MGMVYKFAEGSRVSPSLDPEKVHTVFADIQSRHGELTAETLTDDVEADPEHYLRDQFTWDEELGMRKLHVIEAGNVIRSLRVEKITPEQEEPVRAWVVAKNPETGNQAYYPVLEVMGDKEKAVILLNEVQKDQERAARKQAEFVALMRLLLQ